MKNAQQLEELLRNIPDFPIKGVVFKDITTLLTHPGALSDAVDNMENLLVDIEYDAVVCIESRGFVFGSVLASRKNLPLVLIRKPGKLPADTISQEYSLEYGKNTVEMHRDSLAQGTRVVLIDDLLATGGSALASINLLERDGAIVSATAFLINLEFLGGRKKIEDAGYIVRYVIKVSE